MERGSCFDKYSSYIPVFTKLLRGCGLDLLIVEMEISTDKEKSSHSFLLSDGCRVQCDEYHGTAKYKCVFTLFGKNKNVVFRNTDKTIFSDFLKEKYGRYAPIGKLGF